MNKQNRIRNFLRGEFYKIRNNNPRYSLRSFSNRLGLLSGDLSDFLKGRRSFSDKKLERLLEKYVACPKRRKDLLGAENLTKNFEMEEFLSSEGVEEIHRIVSLLVNKVLEVKSKYPGANKVSIVFNEASGIDIIISNQNSETNINS